MQNRVRLIFYRRSVVRGSGGITRLSFGPTAIQVPAVSR